ncbi:MAG: hypothetical protein ABF643_06890 [Oenococcus oeni]
MIYNETRDNYTIAGNTFIRDPNLSAKAKGILIYLLNLPKDWIFHQSELSDHFKDGYKGLVTGFKELENKGYIKRGQLRQDKGKFSYPDWSVSDKPMFLPIITSHSRQTDNRQTDNRQTDNRQLLSTYSTNNLSIPSTNKTNNNMLNSEFEAFWKLYPKKVAKKNAFEAFKSARKKVDLQTILQGLQIYCANIKTKGTEEKYIKYPQGWLNGERWTDGLDPEVADKLKDQQRHARMIAEMEAAEAEDESGHQ